MQTPSQNPFGCPTTVYNAMAKATPVDMAALWAVRVLGPGRVQYAGRPPKGNGTPKDADTRMSWSLDGKVHVTLGELIDAAEAVAYPADRAA